jgi:hypothetical protein
MTTKPEDEETIVAAEVIKDLLCLVQHEKRLDVLSLATANEKAAREARKDGPRARPVAECLENWEKSPTRNYWHGIMRFKSELIYMLTRHITNSHSKEDAAKLLFRQHRAGGSGWRGERLTSF